jgi:hypothetical protein
MKGKALLLGLLGGLALTGCDSFSLIDQFSSGAQTALALAVDSGTTQRGGIVGLSPSGGTTPYSFTVNAADLYSGTQTAGIGSVSGLTYTAGNAIGKIKITVTDLAGSTVSAFVTVQPPAPTLSGSGRPTPPTSWMTFTYSDTNIIDGFKIDRAEAGGAFSTVASPVKGATTYWPDSGLNPGFLYTYRIYAVSGSYDSPPCEIQL